MFIDAYFRQILRNAITHLTPQTDPSAGSDIRILL
jgi:hypothetical protein